MEQSENTGRMFHDAQRIRQLWPYLVVSNRDYDEVDERARARAIFQAYTKWSTATADVIMEKTSLFICLCNVNLPRTKLKTK